MANMTQHYKNCLHMKWCLFSYFQGSRVCKRWKQGPNHWSTIKKKKTPKYKALEHFDDFYQGVFEDKWPSIRLALLSSKKYCALVNNYSDSERVEENFLNCGAINIKTLIDIEAAKYQKEGKKRIEHSSLNKKMQQINQAKLEEELSSLYPPEGSHQTDNFGSRLIKPSLSLSAGALYEFVPATQLKGREDWIPESQHYSYFETSTDFPVNVENDVINFPETLKVYAFEMGNISKFPSPKKGSTGVSDYYLLDGGSILTVLALDLQHEDTVLDLCAAPGGKSLLCHQTLLPKKVISNDTSESRCKRIKNVLKEFLYNYDKKVSDQELIVTHSDARLESFGDTFDKILVDVPCTTDRLSVTEDDNNIFKQDRIKERIKLPEVQTEILIAALKMVKPGGTVVYSTCSLSPIQNDGVVQRALGILWRETDHAFIVKNLKNALRPYNIIYKFGHFIGLRYGSLVVPYLPSNFGPTYFCKIVKTK